MRAIISFLTKIPVGGTSIAEAAKYQYLFPVVACLIGFITYLVGYVAFSFIPAELAAIITVVALYAVTGLIHLDALSDFSDGMMTKGEKNKKLAAMKDVRIGIAGIFSVLLILILTFYSIQSLGSSGSNKIIFGYEIPLYWLGAALLTSELSAKLSMNTCILAGRRANKGIGAKFIERSSVAKYCVAVAIALSIGFLLTHLYFFIILVGVAIGAIVAGIANKNFGCVTGDAIGASNELARVCTLVVFTMIL